jgi:hypothetical protein
MMALAYKGRGSSDALRVRSQGLKQLVGVDVQEPWPPCSATAPRCTTPQEDIADRATLPYLGGKSRGLLPSLATHEASCRFLKDFAGVSLGGF